MNAGLYRELRECEAAMHNTSTKRLARLKASLAAIRYNAIVASLPGSVRRGLARGNIK